VQRPPSSRAARPVILSEAKDLDRSGCRIRWTAILRRMRCFAALSMTVFGADGGRGRPPGDACAVRAPKAHPAPHAVDASPLTRYHCPSADT
jgi:hypothetical protein